MTCVLSKLASSFGCHGVRTPKLVRSMTPSLFMAFVKLILVYSTRRFVLSLTLCHFVLVFFSPFSITITSLGEERANLSAFRTFVRFVFVWICRFPLPLGVWEGLDDMSLAWPAVVQLLVFIYSGIQ